jgi:hypothetical protein
MSDVHIEARRGTGYGCDSTTMLAKHNASSIILGGKMVFVLLLVMIANFTILGGLMALYAGNFSAGLIAIAIGATPHAVFYLRRKRERERCDAIRAKMLSEAGLPVDSEWAHMEKDSGVAINAVAGTLTLAAEGKMKSYPLSDIREWSTNLATAGQLVLGGGGLAGAVSSGAANIAAGARADAATGFFVTVRDIHNPKWRIQMTKASDQARWMEIMEQTINEKRIPSSNSA